MRLAELVARRQQLVLMKAVEQTREKQAVAAIKLGVIRHLQWLEAEIQSIDVTGKSMVFIKDSKDTANQRRRRLLPLPENYYVY